MNNSSSDSEACAAPTRVSSLAREEDVRQATTSHIWADDPENAKNWRLPKRIYNTLVPALLCLSISFGVAAYSPARLLVQHEFGVDSSLSMLPFSLYVYGLALGPVISAPLSETYGRRFIYIFITPISLIFTIGAGFAKSLTTLALCRFFGGAIGSSPLAVGAGTIMDILGGKHSSQAMALFFVTAFLGPALGSLSVRWAMEFKNWQWSQWITLFLGTSVWILALGAQETYASPHTLQD